MGRCKRQSHNEGDLITEHAKSNPKEADKIVLMNVILVRKQLEETREMETYANGNQDNSSEKLSIESKNEWRHALEGLFSNAVTNAENDLDHDGADVKKPFWRAFYGKRDVLGCTFFWLFMHFCSMLTHQTKKKWIILKHNPWGKHPFSRSIVEGEIVGSLFPHIENEANSDSAKCNPGRNST